MAHASFIEVFIIESINVMPTSGLVSSALK
jgi:hypothetical protein